MVVDAHELYQFYVGYLSLPRVLNDITKAQWNSQLLRNNS